MKQEITIKKLIKIGAYFSSSIRAKRKQAREIPRTRNTEKQTKLDAASHTL